MSENRAKVIAAAISAHAALEALLLELTQEEQGAPSAESRIPPAPATATPCSHENKRHLRTFGVQEHWECEDCGYQFRR